jgi:hypothetical protein
MSGPEVHLREIGNALAAYLRVAHIYMLISMPTGTSTIFGAFQAIFSLPLNPGELRPCSLSYCGSESSPVKSFALMS